jgi:hypothetical protein
MTLNIPIPDNLDESLVRRLDRAAREAVAAQLSAARASGGKLSPQESRRRLDFFGQWVKQVPARPGPALDTRREVIYE